MYTSVHGPIERKVTTKLLLYFAAYLFELAADPNEKIYTINPRYKDCCRLSNNFLALFFN